MIRPSRTALWLTSSQISANFRSLPGASGFKGSEYFASEWDFFTAYPHSDLPSYNDRENHSEMQKAIYASRLSTLFAHLGIVNFWNETFQTMQTMRGLSLFRNTLLERGHLPNAARNHLLHVSHFGHGSGWGDGCRYPRDFFGGAGRFHADKRTGQPVEQYGFRRGRELLIAFWRPGITGENGKDFVSVTVNVSVKSPTANQATLIDVLNGTETPLNISRLGNNLLIAKVHAESWPRILRISNRLRAV